MGSPILSAVLGGGRGWSPSLSLSRHWCQGAEMMILDSVVGSRKSGDRLRVLLPRFAKQPVEKKHGSSTLFHNGIPRRNRHLIHHCIAGKGADLADCVCVVLQQPQVI